MVVGVNIDQHRLCAHIMDGPRHGCQRIGIGQHPVPQRDPACPQRQLDGVAAGGAGNTVINTLPFGIFALKLAGLVAVAFSQIIAMQAATLHDFDGAFDRGAAPGDDVLRLEPEARDAALEDRRDFLCAGRFTAADANVGYALFLGREIGLAGAYAPQTAAYLDRHAGGALREAVDVAAKAHEHQRRKSGEPFIVHPLHVATVLADLRMDADTVMAGLLHDTVEDTSLTVGDIQALAEGREPQSQGGVSLTAGMMKGNVALLKQKQAEIAAAAPGAADAPKETTPLSGAKK